MEDDVKQQILEEIKKLNKISIWRSIVFIIILIIFIAISLILKYNVRQETINDIPIWTQIENARVRADYQEEIRLVRKLLEKNPDDYYLHIYLGSIYISIRDLKNAEKHYERGYELFPLKENEEYLVAVRKLIEENKMKE